MVKNEDIPEFSRRIYKEAGRMIRLVDDIMKLSRLDEGAENLKKENVNLYGMAEEVLKEISSNAKAADVSLFLEGEDTVIYGIPQLLQGIIYNLVDNAIKYNKKGGSVKVTVKGNVNHAYLFVADNGIGIAAEHHERIFERFYRVDKSHSKKTGGTGLGLSIVKHAARLHNAEINIHSIPNRGTEISVVFPKT
jgi:two-component system phosphate regulon sensor histidine kinase PhoR